MRKAHIQSRPSHFIDGKGTVIPEAKETQHSPEGNGETLCSLERVQKIISSALGKGWENLLDLEIQLKEDKEY